MASLLERDILSEQHACKGQESVRPTGYKSKRKRDTIVRLIAQLEFVVLEGHCELSDD